MKTNFNQLVYEEVKKIPKGKVSTYGAIAARIGMHGYARQVGWALHRNPDNSVVPCHRVVNAQGKCAEAFVFGGKNVQQQMLTDEGVGFVGDKVDMKNYCF